MNSVSGAPAAGQAAARQRYDSVLAVEDLYVTFKTYRGTVRALNGVRFHIDKNEVLGLVGETGCGKSVTAFSIARLLPKNATVERGAVYFNGEELLSQPQKEMEKIRGRSLSLIYQEPATALNPVLTLGYQLAEAIMAHEKMPRRQALEKAEEVLAAVMLPNPKRILRQFPHELSGGMRQRVMIAMALSGRPSLIIADEPTTALDVTTQAEILGLMRVMKERFATSMLLVTHDLGVVAEICDRVGVMYAGNLVEIGTAQEIFEDAHHPYTKGLLAAIPNIAERRRKLEIIPGAVPNLISPPEGCRFHPRCPHATKKCLQQPAVAELSPTHTVACHLYGEGEKCA